MSDQSLTLVKHLPVAPEVVFDAWTTPEHMANWFSPAKMPVSIPKLDLRVGGVAFRRLATARSPSKRRLRE